LRAFRDTVLSFFRLTKNNVCVAELYLRKDVDIYLFGIAEVRIDPVENIDDDVDII
jgi:hypothetical protein